MIRFKVVYQCISVLFGLFIMTFIIILFVYLSIYKVTS